MAKKINKTRKTTHGEAPRSGRKQERSAHTAHSGKPQAKSHVRTGSRGGKVKQSARPAGKSTYTGKAKAAVITCTMARVAGTYGFAQPVGAVGREEDIFIPGRYLCGALPGDEVRVTLSPNPRREGTREGEVSEVLPGDGTVTGVLEYDGRTLWLRPDFCSKMLLALDEDDPELDGQKAACLPVYRGRDYDEHVFSVQLCFGDAETAAACCAAVSSTSATFPALSPASSFR